MYFHDIENFLIALAIQFKPLRRYFILSLASPVTANPSNFLLQGLGLCRSVLDLGSDACCKSSVKLQALDVQISTNIEFIQSR